METSQVILNHGLTFLVIATAIIFVIIGGFLVKLLIDLSKLTNNVNDATTIVKSELEPTLKELNNTLKSVNSIVQVADKQVGNVSKLIEHTLCFGSLAFTRAKKLSSRMVKIIVQGIVTIIKIFLKK